MTQSLLRYSMFHDVLFPISGASELTTTKALTLKQIRRYRLEAKAEFRNLPWVVFDFETTGLDSKIDQIIEIGAQKVVKGQVVDQMESLIHCEIPLSERIQQITGITPAMLADQPRLNSVLPQFLEFIQGSVLVAHNAAFDYAFLVEACRLNDIELAGWPTLCTLKLARELLPDLERKNLDTLAEHYGLTFAARHRSIGDVGVTVSVLQELLANEGSHLETWEDARSFSVT